jgi:hypothetical protein
MIFDPVNLNHKSAYFILALSFFAENDAALPHEAYHRNTLMQWWWHK